MIMNDYIPHNEELTWGLFGLQCAALLFKELSGVRDGVAHSEHKI